MVRFHQGQSVRKVQVTVEIYLRGGQVLRLEKVAAVETKKNTDGGFSYLGWTMEHDFKKKLHGINLEAIDAIVVFD